MESTVSTFVILQIVKFLDNLITHYGITVSTPDSGNLFSNDGTEHLVGMMTFYNTVYLPYKA